jgi:hypothetical protein
MLVLVSLLSTNSAGGSLERSDVLDSLLGAVVAFAIACKSARKL